MADKSKERQTGQTGQRSRRKRAGASQLPKGEETATNPQLKALILETVEAQLRADNPHETRQTLERLLAAGHSRRQAMELIGSALVEEIWVILREDKPFDRVRFAALLEKLG